MGPIVTLRHVDPDGGCGSTGMPLSRYDPCNIPIDARCLVPIHMHIGKHRKDTGGERLTRVLSLNHRETPHFRAVGGWVDTCSESEVGCENILWKTSVTKTLDSTT